MENNNIHETPTEIERSAWDLVQDPAFQALLSRFARECIAWDDFLELPFPQGTSPKRTWDLLNSLSKAMGVTLAVPDLEDNWYWYRRTHELTDAVTVVSKACSLDSHLYRTMTAASSQHFLFRTRVEEVIAATRLDGLAISEEDADFLLSFDKTPQTATEHLVVNTFYAMDRLPELVEEPFSKELFERLSALLLEDVDTHELETTPAPLGLTLFDWPDETVERLADRQMDYISAWANHETGSPFDHPAIRAIILNDCFRFYRPLGHVSNQVGRLVAHLYAIKHDLPVLGLLPASRAKLDWCEGRIAPPLVAFDRPTFVELRLKSPGDLTCMATIAAQLMVIALRDVERNVALWERRNAELRTVLKADPYLNERQRTILGRALRDPDSEFSIRYHKTNHGIAYPTARRDFMELVDKEYLSVEQRGRAFVFLPGPGLQGLIGEEAGTVSEGAEEEQTE